MPFRIEQKNLTLVGRAVHDGQTFLGLKPWEYGGHFEKTVMVFLDIGVLLGPKSPVKEASKDYLRNYHPEYMGVKRYVINRDIITASDHGLVVDAMRHELENRGLSVGNDRLRDLYVVDPHKDKMEILFEFKTDNLTSSVYGAIGQLFYHGRRGKNTRLVMVLPSPISDKTKKRILKLNIHCITYEWRNNRFQFNSLSKVIG